MTKPALVIVAVLLFLVGSLCICGPVIARDLVRLAVPEQQHDPLYVDPASIRRSGAIVQFKYVLDVPILGAMSAEGRYPVKGYRSNEFDAVIDCGRQTISVESVTAYASVAAAGDITSRYSPNNSERAPRIVDLRKGSTAGYLYRYLCRPD